VTVNQGGGAAPAPRAIEPRPVLRGTSTASEDGGRKQFGTKPISVAGVVKVEDEVVIEWRLVAHLAR
jgi:hypothetical protein